MKFLLFVLLLSLAFCQGVNQQEFFDKEYDDAEEDLEVHEEFQIIRDLLDELEDFRNFNLDELDETPRNDAIAFLKGLVTGLGGSEDIKKLEECIKNAEAIIKCVKEIAKLLKNIKPFKVPTIIARFINLTRRIAGLLVPCAKEGTIILKLVKAIKNLRPAKISINIIKNIKHIVTSVIQIVKGFRSKDYHTVGEGFGKILRCIFLG